MSPDGGLDGDAPTDGVKNFGPAAPAVDVTVVVVTRNDPRILDCIRCVLDQRTDHQVAVIVVDGRSTDGSRQRLAETFAGDERVRIVDDGRHFLTAWNAAALAANTEIVVRTDSDTQASSAWIDALVAPLVDGSADWAAGMVHGPRPPATWIQRYYDHRTRAFLARMERDEAAVATAPGWNVAYRTNALLAMGGYDDTLVSSEDWDLHHRLVQAGHRGVFVAGAVVTHDHPRTLRVLLRKEAWYRTGQAQLARRHGLGLVAQSLASPAAYLVLAGLFVSAAWWPLALPVALIAAALLVAKQWIGAAAEKDPTFLLRPLLRPLEAAAGVWGLLRGLFGRARDKSATR